MRNKITYIVVVIAMLAAAVYFILPSTKDSTAIQQAVTETKTAPAIHSEQSEEDTTALTQQNKSDNIVLPNKHSQLEPEIQKAVEELVNTSHEGLIEVETEKGVHVDLKGRFRTAPVATIGDDGQVIVRDYTQPPGK